MLDDRLKEDIQKYILNGLSSEKMVEMKRLIESSEDVKKYYDLSLLTWNKIDNTLEVEPSPNYVGKFWQAMSVSDKEERSSFFDIFRVKTLYIIGSFAVFCVISLFLLNIYFTNNGINLSDEEIVTQFEASLTINSYLSLDVFGPWENFNQEL